MLFYLVALILVSNLFLSHNNIHNKLGLATGEVVANNHTAKKEASDIGQTRKEDESTGNNPISSNKIAENTETSSNNDKLGKVDREKMSSKLKELFRNAKLSKNMNKQLGLDEDDSVNKDRDKTMKEDKSRYVNKDPDGNSVENSRVADISRRYTKDLPSSSNDTTSVDAQDINATLVSTIEESTKDISSQISDSVSYSGEERDTSKSATSTGTSIDDVSSTNTQIKDTSSPVEDTSDTGKSATSTETSIDDVSSTKTQIKDTSSPVEDTSDTGKSATSTGTSIGHVSSTNTQLEDMSSPVEDTSDTGKSTTSTETSIGHVSSTNTQMEDTSSPVEDTSDTGKSATSTGTSIDDVSSTKTQLEDMSSPVEDTSDTVFLLPNLFCVKTDLATDTSSIPDDTQDDSKTFKTEKVEDTYKSAYLKEEFIYEAPPTDLDHITASTTSEISEIQQKSSTQDTSWSTTSEDAETTTTENEEAKKLTTTDDEPYTITTSPDLELDNVVASAQEEEIVSTETRDIAGLSTVAQTKDAPSSPSMDQSIPPTVPTRQTSLLDMIFTLDKSIIQQVKSLSQMEAFADILQTLPPGSIIAAIVSLFTAMLILCGCCPSGPVDRSKEIETLQALNDKLNSKVASHEVEIATLLKKIEDISVKFSNIENELSGKIAENKSLQMTLQQQKESLKVIQESLRNQTMALESERNAATNEKRDFLEQINEVKQQLAEKCGQIVDMEIESVSLKRDAIKINDEATDLKDKLQRKIDEINVLRDILTEVEDIDDEDYESLDKAQAKAKKLEMVLDSVKIAAELERTKAKVREEQMAKEKLEAQLRDKIKEVEVQMLRDIHKLHGKVEEVTENQGSISALRAEVEHYKHKIDQLNQELQDVETRSRKQIATYEEKTQAARKKEWTSSQLLKQKNEEMSQLKEDFNQVKEELTELKRNNLKSESTTSTASLASNQTSPQAPPTLPFGPGPLPPPPGSMGPFPFRSLPPRGPLPRRSSADTLQDGASPNLKSPVPRRDSSAREGTANDSMIESNPGNPPIFGQEPPQPMIRPPTDLNQTDNQPRHQSLPTAGLPHSPQVLQNMSPIPRRPVGPPPPMLPYQPRPSPFRHPVGLFQQRLGNPLPPNMPRMPMRAENPANSEANQANNLRNSNV
ncbi:hypothetical protein TrispH2_009411 [Trichoplax sp. H2]|nr:hypothetical protein TrispH2_009411 [Trichoplax sp. H2]|eukprot:RDD38079.1 hypothetical protein TrispH2_009411 [Trichoplax sp. H2]